MKKRRRVKLAIKPSGEGPSYDRTHVIPEGYRESEKDPRVVVGWDSECNQVQMKDFEELVAVRNQNMVILWMTTLRLTANNL